MPTYAGYENVWCGGGAQIHIQAFGFYLDNLGLPELQYYLTESSLDFSSGLCTFQGKVTLFPDLSNNSSLRSDVAIWLPSCGVLVGVNRV